MSNYFINVGAKQLQPYRPGLSPERARALYEVDSFIKMASNENAYGPAPAVAKVLSQPQTLERYPDADQMHITSALAEHCAVASENIVVGAGSSELLDRLARLVLCPGRKAVYSQYAFSLYRQYALCYNAEPVEVPAHPPDHPHAYGHDLEAMADAIDAQTSIVYIASPNNPTGTCNGREPLQRFVDAVPDSVLIVIDQAYAEYAQVLSSDYPELSDWHRRYPNLVITRTFSKIHALASLRIGYLIADAELVEWLKKIRLPFNVSQIAQEAALATLNSLEHAEKCAQGNAAEMETMCALADELNIQFIPSVANFISYILPSPSAPVQECLMRQGIIARTLNEYGLDHHLRLSLGTPAENERAQTALRNCLANV